MNQKQANRVIKLLKEKNLSFDKGLSEEEFKIIEDKFEILFPQDLKLLLQTELPISSGFVNWRFGIKSIEGEKEIKKRLNWPREGILFDIKNNMFWLDEWGTKPSSYEKQKEVALNQLAKQPRLIPIYSHRYISSYPNDTGNPVFSIHQTDIIYYGFDLIDYLSNEFKLVLPKSLKYISEPKQIMFWSNFVD